MYLKLDYAEFGYISNERSRHHTRLCFTAFTPIERYPKNGLHPPAGFIPPE